jgi:hypothetical protein
MKGRSILWTVAMAFSVRTPSDRPGAADFQQPLGSIPRSFNRIFTCYHVHSPREAATKTQRPALVEYSNILLNKSSRTGYIPRKPRLTSEAKGLIRTDRLQNERGILKPGWHVAIVASSPFSLDLIHPAGRNPKESTLRPRLSELKPEFFHNPM